MRLTPQGVIFVIIFALATVVGCFYLAPTHLVKPIRVLTTSTTTEATLDDRYTENVTRRAGVTMTSNNVTYTFTVDGKKYGGSSAISSTPAKTMTVMYLPENPRINGLDLKSHAWIDLVLYFIIVCIFLLALLVLYRHFRNSAAAALEEAAPSTSPAPRSRRQRRH